MHNKGTWWSVGSIELTKKNTSVLGCYEQGNEFSCYIEAVEYVILKSKGKDIPVTGHGGP
jgi:hypothetical protein